MSTEAIFWLVVMILFLILEMITISLVSIWFVGGSLAAFLVSFAVSNIWIEAGVFLGVSLVLLLLIRPMARKLGVKQKDQIRSGAQALVGKRALVTETIDNLHATGAVQVNGQFWSAKAVDDDEIIRKDTVVMISEVDGVRLAVKKLEREKN
jgi:membrane protein implicated in regulation of membrane protease activity